MKSRRIVKKILVVAVFIVLFSIGFYKINMESIANYSQLVLADIKEAELKSQGTYYVTASALNVRKKPWGTRIKSIKRCTRVNVYSESGGWYKISPSSNQWVSGDYLSATKPRGCSSSSKIYMAGTPTYSSLSKTETYESGYDAFYSDKGGTINITINGIEFLDSSTFFSYASFEVTNPYGQNVTSDFSGTFGTLQKNNTNTLKVNLKKGSNYTRGSYRIYVNIGNTKKYVEFYINGPYFALNIDTPELVTDTYNAAYMNVENEWESTYQVTGEYKIKSSNISISSVYNTTDTTVAGFDFKNFFSFSLNSSDKKITFTNKTRGNYEVSGNYVYDSYLPKGTYKLSLEVTTDTGLSNDYEFYFEIGGRYIKLDEPIETSNRNVRTQAYITIDKIDGDNITYRVISKDNSTQSYVDSSNVITESESDFIKKYVSTNLDSLRNEIGSNGYFIYSTEYNSEKLNIYRIDEEDYTYPPDPNTTNTTNTTTTTAARVVHTTVVHYRDAKGNENVMPLSDFNKTYSNVYPQLAAKYKLTSDGYLRKIVDCYSISTGTINQVLRASGGGIASYKIYYDYGLVDPISSDYKTSDYYYDYSSNYDDDLDIQNVEIIYNPTNYSDNPSTTIYKSDWNYSSIENMTNVGSRNTSISNKYFSFDYYLGEDSGGKYITYRVGYYGDQSVEKQYVGAYTVNITYKNAENSDGSATISLPFVLEDSELDYYLKTDLDRHFEKADPLNGGYPPANKKYEYYIGLHMVKGETDPSTNFSPDSLKYKIYSERANLDTNDNLYFYKQTDYQLQIDSITDTQITGTYKERDSASDTAWSNITGTSITISRSDTTGKYKDIIDIINNGGYSGTGGNITSNIDITKIVNSTTGTTLTLKDNSTISSKNYGNRSSTNSTYLVYAMQNFNEDDEGNVIVNTINGSYDTALCGLDTGITCNESDYDVKDEFDVVQTTDSKDYDHAFTITPVTEVKKGRYYVYVDYSSQKGVGYTNDISDAVISKSSYPEYWNRNIHMTFIDYDTPEYEIGLSHYSSTNASDELNTLYYNSQSTEKIAIDPKNIYQYENITYAIEYCDATDVNSCTTWTNAENSFEPIKTDLEKYSVVGELKEHFVTLTTLGEIKKGFYRLVVNYTNPDNNISAPQATYVMDFTNKYRGIVIDKTKTSNINLAHNFSTSSNIYVNAFNLSNPENISATIEWYASEIDVRTLTLKDDGYYYNDVKFFELSHTYAATDEEGNGLYTFKLKNVANNSEIGKYRIIFSYTEDGVTKTDSMYFNVVENNYSYHFLDGYTPYADDDKMGFKIDFETSDMTKEEAENISFIIYYNDADSDTPQTVDVSSDDVDSSTRVFTSQTVTVSCADDGSATCSGTVDFTINKDLLDLDGGYFIEATYPKGQNPEDKSLNFREIFDWSFKSLDITGTFTDASGNVEDVNEFYRNIDDTKLTATIDSPAHTNNVKWSINTSCIDNSDTCNPTNNQYGSYFTDNNTTGENGTLELTIKDKNNVIPAGTYALVLYYSQTDYNIKTFTVNSQYARISFNDDIEETSVINGKTVNGLYVNSDGTITGTYSVSGISTSDVVLKITDISGNDMSNVFSIDEDEKNKGNVKVTYNKGKLSATDTYTLHAIYNTQDNEETVEDTYTFDVYQTYFDFSIDSVVYEPDPLIPNNPDGGKVKFLIKTDNIDYIYTGSDGLLGSSAVAKFINNSSMVSLAGDNVKGQYTLSYEKVDETSFYIVASYASDVLSPGKYTFETSYTINGKTVINNIDYNVSDYQSKIIIAKNPTITTTSSDGLVHNNIGGSFSYKYTSEHGTFLSNLVISLTDSSGNKVDSTYYTTDVNESSIVININQDKFSSGDYNIVFTYTDPNLNITTTTTRTIHIYDKYKELEIYSMIPSTSPIYSDKDGQYYTFKLNSSSLDSTDLTLTSCIIEDAAGNDVTSSFTITNSQTDTNVITYKIGINSFKAPAGTYKAYIKYTKGDSTSISNKLNFVINGNYYQLTLDDSSSITTKKSYKSNPDAIYDKDGFNINYTYSTTYPTDDTSVFSIKIYKNLKEVKELKDVTTSVEDGITYLHQVSDVTDLPEGDYTVSVCINGNPYTTQNLKVNKYISVETLSLLVDGSEVTTDSIDMITNNSSSFQVLYTPSNATDTDFTMESSDSSIVKIENNIITALKSGSATITVKNSDLTKTLTINVKAPLDSDYYSVDHDNKILFINKLTNGETSVSLDELVSHLTGLNSGYKLYKNGSDVTSSVSSSNTLIGTNMTLSNPGDATYTIILIGDVNADGKVTLTDVARIYAHVSNPTRKITDKNLLKAAEIRKTDTITVTDVSKLYSYVNGYLKNI